MSTNSSSSKQEEKKVIITDPNMFTTSNVLNKYEVTAVLSKRVVEIEEGAEFDEELLNEVTDPKFTAIQLAQSELRYGLIPYFFDRKIGPNTYERHFISEMYYYED
jgi:DNA-directed RNA polymerase subunit K/omega